MGPIENLDGFHVGLVLHFVTNYTTTLEDADLLSAC